MLPRGLEFLAGEYFAEPVDDYQARLLLVVRSKYNLV